MAGIRLRHAELACSDLGGEIVLLDLRCSTYFTVQGSAAVLVSMLRDGAGAQPETLVRRLLDTYETTEETAQKDVHEFIASLENRDLIEHVPDS